MLILYAIPFFMLLIVVEAIFDWRKKTGYFRFNDAVNSLSTGMLSRTMGFLTLYVNWAAYSHLYDYFGWYQLPNGWLVAIAAFVIYDFFYYWSHRVAHVYSILWNAHAVHHQSEEFNLTTALRQPFTGFVQGSIVYLPMVFMGFEPTIIATVGSLNLIYQFWVHTRFVPKLGAVEWVMVTPSNHRVHHGMNDRYIDKNFGGVFIVWDRLFKTFEDERDDDPVIFGVRKQLNSFNPFFANVQIYWQMVKDIITGRSLTLAWQVLTSRTGQRPDAIAAKAPIARLDLNTFKTFNPNVSRANQILVWSQLLFSLGYTVWFMLFVKETEFVPALLHFLPLGLALYSMGLLLEGKSSGWFSEGLRLAYMAVALFWLPVAWPVSLFTGYLVIAFLVFAGCWISLRRLSISESAAKHV